MRLVRWAFPNRRSLIFWRLRTNLAFLTERFAAFRAYPYVRPEGLCPGLRNDEASARMKFQDRPTGEAEDRSDRLAFHQIDDESRSLLRRFWPLVEAQLPTILDGFYAHVAQVPALAGLVGAQAARLKGAQ